jgi:hypothetical protein
MVGPKRRGRQLHARCQPEKLIGVVEIIEPCGSNQGKAVVDAALLRIEQIGLIETLRSGSGIIIDRNARIPALIAVPAALDRSGTLSSTASTSFWSDAFCASVFSAKLKKGASLAGTRYVLRLTLTPGAISTF